MSASSNGDGMSNILCVLSSYEFGRIFCINPWINHSFLTMEVNSFHVKKFQTKRSVQIYGRNELFLKLQNVTHSQLTC